MSIYLTPEQAKEAIAIRCNKRFKEMTEKGCDPIIVEAIITPKGRTKDVKVKLLPYIVTPEKFIEFVTRYGGEYMYDEIDNCHRRIFWLKPTPESKTIADLFALNINEIFEAFRRLDNKKIDLSTEGGILTI